jgi:hypothetical protein
MINIMYTVFKPFFCRTAYLRIEGWGWGGGLSVPCLLIQEEECLFKCSPYIHDIFAVMWREARETKPYFRTQEKSITRYHTGLSTRCHYQNGIQCLAIGDRENIVKIRIGRSG